MPNTPRSAHKFPAVKAPPVEGFKPTHVRVETGEPLELLDGEVKTYPTMYLGVVVRDASGSRFYISDEVWDQRKRKKLVNYVPIEEYDNE